MGTSKFTFYLHTRGRSALPSKSPFVPQSLSDLYTTHKGIAEKAVKFLQTKVSCENAKLLRMTCENICRSYLDNFAKQQLLQQTQDIDGVGDVSIDPLSAYQREAGPLVQSRRMINAQKGWERLHEQNIDYADGSKYIIAGLVPALPIKFLLPDLSNVNEILERLDRNRRRRLRIRKLLGSISDGGLCLYEVQADKYIEQVLPHEHYLLSQDAHQSEWLLESCIKSCRKWLRIGPMIHDRLITPERLPLLFIWSVLLGRLLPQTYFERKAKAQLRRSWFYHHGLRRLPLRATDREQTTKQHQYILKSLEHREYKQEEDAIRAFATVALCETAIRLHGRCSVTFGTWHANGTVGSEARKRSALRQFRIACKEHGESLESLLIGWEKIDKKEQAKGRAKQ